MSVITGFENTQSPYYERSTKRRREDGVSETAAHSKPRDLKADIDSYSFEEKEKIFEEKSGRKSSEVELGYMGQFLLKGPTGGSGNHEDAVKGLAEMYDEMYQEILTTYEGQEDEMNKQLDELNRAFKQSLKNTNLKPLYPLRNELKATWGDAETSEAALAAKEEEIKKQAERKQQTDSINDIFSKNMQKYIDVFYEEFTSSIGDKGFQQAFDDSMALLKESETTSYEDISYDDLQKIRNVMRNEAVAFDKDGRPTDYRYDSMEDALKALCDDDTIPASVRDRISEILGYAAKADDSEQIDDPAKADDSVIADDL